jgi:hypothetical protein
VVGALPFIKKKINKYNLRVQDTGTNPVRKRDNTPHLTNPTTGNHPAEQSRTGRTTAETKELALQKNKKHPRRQFAADVRSTFTLRY